MQERRNFLKKAVIATSAAAVAAMTKASAAETGPYLNVVYTKDNPGKWAGKQGSHAPEITVAGSTVTVANKHGMSDEHFIVRHTLVLADGTVVGGKTFTPSDKPESTYELPAGYKGKVKATSFCNQHDFWLTEAAV